MTRRADDEVLALTRRYLELVEGRELSPDEKHAFIAETVEAYERHVNRGFLMYRKSVTEAGQFAALEWSGRGSILEDLLGREYIDCLGGYGIFGAGVNHPRILRAVAGQMERMALNSQELLEPWRAALARLLSMVTPGELSNAFFINNGTDAIEGAIKLARLYTRRNLFVSTLNGFHGKSMGSLSLMGKASFREPFAGGLQDVRFVPYGDADALEAELAKAEQVGTPVAGFVVEPVQGEAGGVVPPDDYLPRARELCTRFGALLIADEIQTGMGRTGALWGVDHTGTVPDIMCLGKSLGGGIMPLSAFIAPAEIWEVLVPNPIIHSTTFGGNPMACVAGIAAIQVTLEEDLPGHAAEKGRFLLRELATLQGKYPQVLTDVHGKGLLIGLEFPTDETGFRCAAGLFKRGVLVAGTYSKARTIRIEPALGIPMKLLGELLTRLEDTFREIAGSSA
ncbi:MAG TPA: aminotransferase class III-fold pyridoxal phosphate-dependent enzyme [Gemmatimonadales bacterium]|nr:aminotransferase class III-fold pyridoxal phosphate-dependent enzyme [Gemmatimonadales bacterium]